ncbi:unnamed protein product [Paramecium octaurelia]|uniref:Uncharacterized protein n=1 Tax=Paramecium octaurelia TaxID=43137 RepID=A0A8S1YGN0_PAROT|nr:unnamed protein product [Paramecium octaurelia]
MKTLEGRLVYKNGLKVGTWIEPVDTWLKLKREIQLKGEYTNQFKYGQWEIIEGNERKLQEENHLIQKDLWQEIGLRQIIIGAEILKRQNIW